MLLPDGAAFGQIEDRLVAVRHAPVELITKLFEAEYLHLIARQDLTHGVGDEALASVVVAGLKTVDIRSKKYIFFGMPAIFGEDALTSTKMGESERHSAHTSCSDSAWKRWTPFPMWRLIFSICGLRFTLLSCPRQKQLSFCEEGFVKPSTKTSGDLAWNPCGLIPKVCVKNGLRLSTVRWFCWEDGVMFLEIAPYARFCLG